MKLFKPALGMTFALVFVLCCAAYAQTASPPFSPTNLPFSLSIRAEQDHVMAGTHVSIEYTLKNISKEAIRPLCAAVYPAGSLNDVFTIELYGPDGKMAELSGAGLAYAKSRPSSEKERDYMCLVVPSIAPGSIRKGRVDPGDYFDTWTLGTYTVQIKLKLPERLGGGIVESNKVLITTTYNPIMERLERQGALKSKK